MVTVSISNVRDLRNKLISNFSFVAEGERARVARACANAAIVRARAHSRKKQKYNEDFDANGGQLERNELLTCGARVCRHHSDAAALSLAFSLATLPVNPLDFSDDPAEPTDGAARLGVAAADVVDAEGDVVIVAPVDVTTCARACVSSVHTGLRVLSLAASSDL
jgi:hypothetical protein